MSSSGKPPTFVELSWVEITEEDLKKVEARSGLPLEQLQRYLDSDEQDNNILRHFAFFGVYPRGKLFQ